MTWQPPDPVTLVQQLIRFDTTNPPGDEAEAIGFVAGILAAAGVETRLIESAPGRPNLIARFAGSGAAPPLLMQAHIDVVPADPVQWTYPPFEGRIEDGFLWGRGALDMKSGLAMMVTAMLRARAAGAVPPGDVILAILADEEAGGDHGAGYLVDRFPELFAGVRYAIGEFGGFTLDLAGRRLAPIQVAEKQICTVRATIRGSGGHGSLALDDGVVARLAVALRKLSRPRLPIHVIPVVGRMIEAIAAELPPAAARAARLARRPALTDALLRVAGDPGSALVPLFRNTATPNLIRSGEKINVQPTSAEIMLDGRVLPGYGPADLVGELRGLLGAGFEFEVERFDPVPTEVDLGLFPTLAGVLRDQDPSLRPVPMLLPASTDGRFFSRLGIQSYGFTPMTLPASMKFSTLVHGANERIPVDAIEMGTQCIERLLERFGTAA